jgi:hypothetical protein
MTPTLPKRINFPVEVGERWPVIRTGWRDPISSSLRQHIYARDGRRCRFCFTGSQHLELDHIVPWSAGGPDTTDNLRSLCHNCNTARSNRRTASDEPATPITLACDDCIRDWIRRYGFTRYGRCIPGALEIEAFCGNCGETSFVTDPRRLQ